MLTIILVLLICVGMIGGYVGVRIGQPKHIEVSQSDNSSNTIVPVSQQITVSPGKLASDTIANTSKSIYLLAHQTTKGLKGFAIALAVTNDGILVSTENGGTDATYAIGEDATSTQITPVGTDTLTGLHFFKLTNKVITPIDVAQTMPRIGATLLAVSKSDTTTTPQAEITLLSSIIPAQSDTPAGIQRVGMLQPIPNAPTGSSIISEDGKLAGLLLQKDTSTIIFASDIAQAISRLSNNALTQDPFTDFGFSVSWTLQQDDQSRIAIRPVISSVSPKGIAAQAGLKTSDIITTINTSTITWDNNIATLLSGNQIQVTVLRNNAPITLTLTRQS
jgi:hypothetical protein